MCTLAIVHMPSHYCGQARNKIKILANINEVANTLGCRLTPLDANYTQSNNHMLLDELRCHDRSFNKPCLKKMAETVAAT